MMTEIARHWVLQVDVGPEWLFLRLSRTSPDADPEPPFAERAWEIAESHRIFRFVVEFDPSVMLSSHLVGQLVLLHKRSYQVNGVTRICCFPPTAYEVLRIAQLEERFPNYQSRYDAVMGYRPPTPEVTSKHGAG